MKITTEYKRGSKNFQCYNVIWLGAISDMHFKHSEGDVSMKLVAKTLMNKWWIDVLRAINTKLLVIQWRIQCSKEICASTVVSSKSHKLCFVEA